MPLCLQFSALKPVGCGFHSLNLWAKLNFSMRCSCRMSPKVSCVQRVNGSWGHHSWLAIWRWGLVRNESLEVWSGRLYCCAKIFPSLFASYSFLSLWPSAMPFLPWSQPCMGKITCPSLSFSCQVLCPSNKKVIKTDCGAKSRLLPWL